MSVSNSCAPILFQFWKRHEKSVVWPTEKRILSGSLSAPLATQEILA
jgi:hypothetical protein